VDAYLPPPTHRVVRARESPVARGAGGTPPYYMEFRYMLDRALHGSRKVIEEVAEDYGRRFGRRYGLLEAYGCDDADFIMVTMGSLAGEVKDVVDRLGSRFGVVKIRSFRPFPSEELAALLAGAKGIGVMEKDISLGSFGALFLDVAGSLALAGVRIPAVNFICGLANRDVTPADIEGAFGMVEKAAERGKPVGETVWLGLKRELLEGGT